jgi:hypothetical protein
MSLGGIVSDRSLLSMSLLEKAASTASKGQGLTAAEATIIAAGGTALAVLVVGILNILTQRKQLSSQERQFNRQLTEQRELLEHQLEAQRLQTEQQLVSQREQFERQSAEQRDIRRAEQESENAKISREERKSAYMKMLAGCRDIEATFSLVANQHPQSLLANLQPIMSRLEADREDVRIGLSEIELFASDFVVDLVVQYNEQSGRLVSIFVGLSEAAIQLNGGQPTPETLAEAQAAVRDTIVRIGINQTYLRMRDTMRGELLN